MCSDNEKLLPKQIAVDREFLVTMRRALMMIAKSDNADEAIRQAVLATIRVIESRLML